MALMTGVALVACAALAVWQTSHMATAGETAIVLATLGAALIVAIVVLVQGRDAPRPRRRG